MHLSLYGGVTVRNEGFVLDQQLADGLRQRRTEVIDELLLRYGREIVTVANLILRDRSDAEDVLIETLQRAWERGAQLRDGAALRAWLLAIATNQSLMLRRRLMRPFRLSGHQIRTVSPDHAPTSDLRLSLLAEVDRLPPRTRAVLVLRYYADLGIEDIAVAVGRSPNTVKTQLREGLAQLRRQLPASDRAGRDLGHG